MFLALFLYNRSRRVVRFCINLDLRLGSIDCVVYSLVFLLEQKNYKSIILTSLGERLRRRKKNAEILEALSIKKCQLYSPHLFEIFDRSIPSFSFSLLNIVYVLIKLILYLQNPDSICPFVYKIFCVCI
jgi:hypothetical protein